MASVSLARLRVASQLLLEAVSLGLLLVEHLNNNPELKARLYAWIQRSRRV